MRKILFSDLDGTIIGEQSLPLHEKNLPGLNQFRQAGHLVALCTGRNHIDLLPTLKISPIPYDYLVLCNGSYIVDSRGQVIEEHPIPLLLGKEMLEKFAKEKQLVTYFCDEHYCVCKNSSGIRVIDQSGKISEYSDSSLFYTYLKEAEKLTIIGINQEDHQTDFLDAYVKDVLPQYERYISWSYNTTYIDIMAKGSSKGNGMLRLADYLHIPVKNVYAVGDSFNDISMLQQAGTSYTFHRSELKVQKQADHLIDALYEVIEDILI